MFSKIILASAAVMFATIAVAEQQEGRFSIYQGTISGLSGGEPPTVTILIDSLTGQSWMLAVLDNSPKWMPLGFSVPMPAHTLPPEGKE